MTAARIAHRKPWSAAGWSAGGIHAVSCNTTASSEPSWKYRASVLDAFSTHYSLILGTRVSRTPTRGLGALSYAPVARRRLNLAMRLRLMFALTLERRRLERWLHSRRVVQRHGSFRTVLEVSGIRIGRFLHPLLPDPWHPSFLWSSTDP